MAKPEFTQETGSTLARQQRNAKVVTFYAEAHGSDALGMDPA